MHSKGLSGPRSAFARSHWWRRLRQRLIIPKMRTIATLQWPNDNSSGQILGQWSLSAMSDGVPRNRLASPDLRFRFPFGRLMLQPYGESDPVFCHIDECQFLSRFVLPLGKDQALGSVAPVARCQLGRRDSHRLCSNTPEGGTGRLPPSPDAMPPSHTKPRFRRPKHTPRLGRPWSAFCGGIRPPAICRGPLLFWHAT
jgi:hypothetical protein